MRLLDMNKVAIPDAGDDRVLRNVLLGDTGYRLLLWDTYRTDRLHKSILGYAFYAPKDEAPLFSGEDFGCSPMDPVDSDATLRSLLTFLTLRPGDTDPEYFEEYTEEQRAFCAGDAEMLQDWATDPRESDCPEEHAAYACFVDAPSETLPSALAMPTHSACCADQWKDGYCPVHGERS